MYVLAFYQTDVFCLRERDLLNRFAAEVSTNLKQGRNKEYAFVLVRVLS